MNTPQRFQDKEYINWLKCSLAFTCMKEALHDYIDNGVKKLHLDIKQNLLSTLGEPFVGKTCGSCDWHNVRKDRNNWSIKCKNSVCDKWLSEILTMHIIPQVPSINWRNADISRWPTDPYEVAKVFMPKGQDRTKKLPQELDVPAALSLLKYCTSFCTKIPNVSLLSELIDFRNEVLHSGELKVLDSDKDCHIDKMIELLHDLNIDSSADSELNRIKCEDIDMNFKENEIKALQNLVSDLHSKFDEVKEEITSVQNLQMHQSDETNKHTEEVKKSLQELKESYDRMELFLKKNPDINDKGITSNMTDLKSDFHSLQIELSQVKVEVSQVKVEVSSLRDQLEKHKEDTQLQIKGVERQLADLEDKTSGGATASSSSDRFHSDQPVHKITDLRPYLEGWKICAQVTSKGRITYYKKYKKRQNFTFADDSGSIDAVAFGETVNRFDDLLQDQKVFYVSNAIIQNANSMFSGGNPYDMILTDETEIKVCKEDSKVHSVQIRFKRVMIDKLKPGRVYDVIGVAKDHREKRVQKWQGIEVLLVDQSRKMVALNLNKKDVENHNLLGNPVVAVSGAFLKQSSGHVYLKMMPNSKLWVNPTGIINEAEELHKWFKSEGHLIEFKKYNSG